MENKLVTATQPSATCDCKHSCPPGPHGEPPAPDGFAALAQLPREQFLDAGALAKLLGCHRKTIWRTARRGELPEPFRFMGRLGWTAGAIADHLEARQAEALRQASRRNSKRALPT